MVSTLKYSNSLFYVYLAICLEKTSENSKFKAFISVINGQKKVPMETLLKCEQSILVN
jgi:hypothetical protein